MDALKPDLSDDTFDRTTKVHDWRNHVPPTVKDHWRELSESERDFVAMVAQHAADNEIWD